MRPAIVVAVVTLLVLVPHGVSAQSQGEIWKAFAKQLTIGADLTVRLENGQRFRATLIGVTEDALLVQPRTRVPVPVQPVSYDEIETLERRQARKGMHPGKAAGIGVASGAGAFLAILLILLSGLD
jgi:hypothetical protein